MTTVSLWRIGADTPDYTAEDSSGEGARQTGGRWNRKGTAVLYSAVTRALAYLETVVHLRAVGLPLNRYLVEILVPEDVWVARVDGAPSVGWDALPAGKVSLDFGDAWVAGGSSALCTVPSIIVPEERCVLINPAHADVAKLKFVKVVRIAYDSRLF